MSCPRCEADPTPANSEPRRCAFRDPFFTADNWRCASLEALLDAAETRQRSLRENSGRFYGYDESLDLIPCDPDGAMGWIVLTRYKHRGKVSSAVHVGDHAPSSVTLMLVDDTITYLQKGTT